MKHLILAAFAVLMAVSGMAVVSHDAQAHTCVPYACR